MTKSNIIFSLQNKWKKDKEKDKDYIINAHYIVDIDGYTKRTISNSFSDNLWLISIFP